VGHPAQRAAVFSAWARRNDRVPCVSSERRPAGQLQLGWRRAAVGCARRAADPIAAWA
jgi:hypothetical protein